MPGLGGRGRGGVSFSGGRVSVLPDENILEMGCTTRWMDVLDASERCP